MSYNLFLDDFRSLSDAHSYTYYPPYATKDWVIVRSYDEFVKYIEEHGVPEMVSFDHDLADEHYNFQSDIQYDDYQEKTGFHCARWLIYYCLDNDKKLPPVIMIHSMNKVGAENIKSLFDTFNKVHENNPPYFKPNPSLDIDPPELFQ